MLAVARVIGETAPLLVTTGSIDTTNLDPFGRPDGEPAGLCVYEQAKFPGVPPEAFIERAWAGRSFDPDRDGAFPGGPAHQSTLWWRSADEPDRDYEGERDG